MLSRPSAVFRASCIAVSHSHTTILRQPNFLSARACSLSRAAFPFSFSSHHSRRFVGVVQFLQLLCRCQKQPCTKMAVLYFGRRISTETALIFRGFTFFGPWIPICVHLWLDSCHLAERECGHATGTDNPFDAATSARLFPASYPSPESGSCSSSAALLSAGLSYPKFMPRQIPGTIHKGTF